MERPTYQERVVIEKIVLSLRSQEEQAQHTLQTLWMCIMVGQKQRDVGKSEQASLSWFSKDRMGEEGLAG